MSKDVFGHMRFRIRVDPTGDCQKQVAAAIPYYEAIDSKLNAAITRAMAKTYIKAFEKAFLGSLQTALRMEVLDAYHKKGGEKVQLRSVFTERTAYLKSLHEVRKVAGAGSSKKAQRAAKARLDETRVEYMKATRKRSSKARAKSMANMNSGSFRALAMQILHKVADPARLSIAEKGNSMLVGAGALKDVESIATPSATPKVWGRESGSPYQVLWRQLEYGTGNFADMAYVNRRTRGGGTGLGDRSWEYPVPLGEMSGDGQPFVIHIRFGGSEPMHVLKQVTEQSQRLGKDFLRFLSTELSGVA